MSTWPDELAAGRGLAALQQDAEILVDGDLHVVADNGVLRRWLGLPEGAVAADELVAAADAAAYAAKRAGRDAIHLAE